MNLKPQTKRIPVCIPDIFWFNGDVICPTCVEFATADPEDNPE